MFLTMGYGVYFFFASLMILSIPFVYFLIPETKSVPLEAMDRLFEIKQQRRRRIRGLKECKILLLILHWPQEIGVSIKFPWYIFQLGRTM